MTHNGRIWFHIETQRDDKKNGPSIKKDRLAHNQ